MSAHRMNKPSGYPVILNGDHAEFEAEHASTPLRERPDWPMPSFDARDWAEAFCKIAKAQGHDLDEGWMITWFSCALMRGYDEHAREVANYEAGETARNRRVTAWLLGAWVASWVLVGCAIWWPR